MSVAEHTELLDIGPFDQLGRQTDFLVDAITTDMCERNPLTLAGIVTNFERGILELPSKCASAIVATRVTLDLLNNGRGVDQGWGVFAMTLAEILASQNNTIYKGQNG